MLRNVHLLICPFTLFGAIKHKNIHDIHYDTLESKGAAQSRQNMFKRFLIPPHNLLKHFYCHHSVHPDDILYNLHESPFMEAWLNFTGICSICTYNYTFAQNCISLKRVISLQHHVA